MRLNLLYQLDDLQENCKTCDQSNNTISHKVTCKGCPTYAEISQIGKQLLSIKKERKPMADKVVLDQDSYSVLKSQGKSDADISRQFGIKQATLIYYKKKWATSEVQPDTVEVKPSECHCTKEDNSAEYERIINEQNKTIAEQIRNQEKLNKIIDDYENVNAACEDVENEIASLREEKDKLQGQYNAAINRRVTTHNGITMDDEELTIINIWQENTGKQEIRKQIPYCKTYQLLVERNNQFEFLEKNA